MVWGATVVALALSTAIPAGADAPMTTRVSVSSDGAQGNAASVDASISGDGRYVAFHSWASTLVPGDTNGVSDVFVHDRLTHTTVRASVSSAGEQASGGVFGGESLVPSISGDGRYVAFFSHATNLVSGKGTGIYVRDLVASTTSFASPGIAPSISADGRYVAFWSGAANLVPGDTNGVADIFVYDRLTGVTVRVSVSSSGEQGNELSAFTAQGRHISANGRFVTFYSHASNLVAGDTNSCYPFTDPGECTDIFVRDRDADGNGTLDEPGGISTERVSVSSTGQQGNSVSESPAISGGGRYVAFSSYASNLVPNDTNVCGTFSNSNSCIDVFVHDRLSHTTSRVSVTSEGGQGLSDSNNPSISADGRYVAFDTDALLAPCDSNGKVDVVLHDRLTGQTTLVSVANSSRQSNALSGLSSISEDGSVVAFLSGASTLDATGPAGFVHHDTNGTADIYVREGANQSHPLGPASGALYRTDFGPGTPTVRTVVCEFVWPGGL
jgi:Tol biopolymer transport system component